MLAGFDFKRICELQLLLFPPDFALGKLEPTSFLASINDEMWDGSVSDAAIVSYYQLRKRDRIEA